MGDERTWTIYVCPDDSQDYSSTPLSAPFDHWQPVRVVPASVLEERDRTLSFFIDRQLRPTSEWVGASSNAMLAAAITGEPPVHWPSDRGDLDRCEETYRRAPAHLQEKMLPILERFRRGLGLVPAPQDREPA